MTTAKELGMEGLKSFVGKKVVMTYPETEHNRRFRKKVTITEIFGASEGIPGMAALAAIKGTLGSTWIWDDTDVFEVQPSRIEQTLQRIKKALGWS